MFKYQHQNVISEHQSVASMTARHYNPLPTEWTLKNKAVLVIQP